MFEKSLTELEVAHLKSKVALLEHELKETRDLLMDCVLLVLNEQKKLEILSSDFLFHHNFLYHLQPSEDGKKFKPFKPKISPESEFDIVAKRVALLKRTKDLHSTAQRPEPPVE